MTRFTLSRRKPCAGHAVRRRRLLSNHQFGVSMIEIMIGVIILALVLVPSIQVVLSGTRTVTATRDHVGAVFLAQNLIETARTYDFDRLSLDNGGPNTAQQKETLEWDLFNDDNDPVYDKIKKDQKINGIDYNIIPDQSNTSTARFMHNLPINPADPLSPSNVCLFRFTIKWRGQDGKEHTHDFSTAIARMK